MRGRLFSTAVLLVGMSIALWAPALCRTPTEPIGQAHAATTSFDLAKHAKEPISQAHTATTERTGIGTISASALPPEARTTLDLIKKGGPFAYPKDGIVFGNREKRLPPKPRGYYREYTVKTPGSRTRGARRIVAGQPGEFYYSDDHYNTFRLIRE